MNYRNLDSFCLEETLADICDEFPGTCHRREMMVQIEVQGQKILAEVDTAAHSLWVNSNWFSEFVQSKIDPDVGEVKAADQSIMHSYGSSYMTFNLWNAVFKNYPVRLLNGLKAKVLIGRSFWIRCGLRMDLEKGIGSIRIGDKRLSGPIFFQKETRVDEHVSAIEEEREIDDAIKTMNLSSFSGSKSEQEKLRSLLWKKRGIFKGVGSIKGITHRIKLKEGAQPVNLPMRRRSPAQRKAEETEVKKLVEMKVLEPSTSPWGTLNVFVLKKDKKTLRTTSDFRRLNELTESDVYPMEDMKATIDWLSSKKIYSVFDLKDGFFQVELAVESRPLTAVRTVLGLFQYTRLPMGLKNSPATFQRVVNEVLGDLKGQNVWCYMDDASVGSMNTEDHLKDLETVLTRFEDAGVKLKFSKCEFGTREATVLGHTITRNGIMPSEDHLKAIRNLKEPKNGSELLRFLGLVNFFGDFVENFANRAMPLYDLLKGSGIKKKKGKRTLVKIPDFEKKWGSDQKEAWLDLKGDLSNPKVLASPG